jgi:hypothetical protein
LIRRRGLFLALTISAVYLVAVSATVALRDGHVRPLYDAFVPPSAYRFVDPPAFFASGNVKPTAISTTVAVGPGGSDPFGIATPDGQFVINLGRGAIAAKLGATTVAVLIAPVAPNQLPPIPAPLRPNGNAYHVEFTYRPHGGTVTQLTKPGTLLLEIPEVGQRLFASANAGWIPVPSRVIGPSQLTTTATFGAPGYYLAATNLPELAAPAGHSSHVAIVMGAATAILAALMFLGALAVVRKRRHAADHGRNGELLSD